NSDDPTAPPTVLRRVRDTKLGGPRRRHGAPAATNGAHRVRPGLPHSRRDRRRLGLRPLAVGAPGATSATATTAIAEWAGPVGPAHSAIWTQAPFGFSYAAITERMQYPARLCARAF